MGGPILGLACLLSLAALLQGWLSGPEAVEPGTSTVAQALLPWVALAGIPRARPSAAGERARWVVECAAALPFLAVAAALDHAATGWAAWIATLISGVLLVGLLAFAAERAGGAPLHALLWLALVPGAALLSAALTWGAPPSAWDALGRASPAGWCWEQARGAAWPPWLPLAVGATLVAAASSRPARFKSAPAALAALVLLTPGVRAQGEIPVGRARVLLEGPLGGLEVDASGAGPTRIRGTLEAGERRELEVPLLLPPGPLPTPNFTLQGDGSATLLGWADSSASAWERLPFSLRARPAPPLVREGGPEPAPWSVLAAVAAVLLVLGVRKRPAAAVALSIACSAGLFAALASRERGTPGLRVLECDLAAQRYLANDVHAGRAPLTAALARLELEPEGSPVHVRGVLEASTRWEVVAPGAILRISSEVDPGARRLTAAGNAWGDLEELYLRSPDGRWQALGAWRMGEPRPAGGVSAEPPGWINPALPMGTEVLLGRFAPGAWSGPAPAPALAWIRAVGSPGD